MRQYVMYQYVMFQYVYAYGLIGLPVCVDRYGLRRGCERRR